MQAKFKHKASGREYTVVLRVTVSVDQSHQLGGLRDMETVGIRLTDFGHIAVAMPNIGVEDTATVQGSLSNGDQCLLYRGEDGSLWLRKTSEFTDGRFQPLDARAACMMPAAWHLTGGGMA